MLSRHLPLGLLLLGLLPAIAFAQSAVVTGVVIDARTEQPLPRARVVVDGTSQSVETDAQGQFRLAVQPGEIAITVSLIGYALGRQVVTTAADATATVTFRLSEGAGQYAEQVTVSGNKSADTASVAGAVALHGRDLQALRGVTLDDPLRALHSWPSAASTDDFYSEFAVRGSPFRNVGLTADGIPSRYLMHAVHGITDGGSIAMINTDAVGSLSLLPGSYPQRTGRRMGAQVDLTLREGARDGFRARAGLSGTSATFLAEGPLANGRGSWLATARRSYLDLLLNRIDDENSLGFGFTDVESKIVFDLSSKHQIQGLAVIGRSDFDERADDLAPNDEATVDGQSWLSSLTWRYTPSTRLLWTNRAYATGLTYDNRNHDGAQLDDSTASEIGWRTDASIVVHRNVLVEAGGDVVRGSSHHSRWRSLNDAPDLSPLSSFRESAVAASAYAQVALGPLSRVTVTPGVRVDRWGLTDSVATSPWITTTIAVAAGTTIRAGIGRYTQFPDFEQVYGIHGGGTGLRPEHARHIDAGVVQRLRGNAELQVTWFARDERDVLWTPDAEPRRLADGTIQPGRGDAPWVNALRGRTRGVEVVLRRDAAARLSGWVGYAYGRHRYTYDERAEEFWGDFDQRHALSLFGLYRLSNRTTIGAKFRYGSNYPLVGYIREETGASDLPPLFGGERPLFYELGGERNTLRLPGYARLDLRLDRTFSWGSRRITVFVELANAFNRQNVRNVPYFVTQPGRVFGPTDSMMPILPSAGFVIDF